MSNALDRCEFNIGDKPYADYSVNELAVYLYKKYSDNPMRKLRELHEQGLIGDILYTETISVIGGISQC